MNETKCMWCGNVIEKPRPGQKQCKKWCLARGATIQDYFARIDQERQQRQMEDWSEPKEIGD